MGHSIYFPPRNIFRSRILQSFILGFALSVVCYAQTEITLKNSFIRKYMNRVTIETDFIIDHAHKKPNAVENAGKDGDLHIAGRSSDIGLPMVVEIANAKAEADALNYVKSKEGTNESVKIAGAWRLWCEHPGSKGHVQGRRVAIPENTNPDHVFEIHPVTKIGNIDLLGSLRAIDGYDAYPATKALPAFEKKQCEIKPNSSKNTITIITSKIGYNYVEFVMEITNEGQHEVEDGRFVTANVIGSDGDLVATDIRMAFTKGSEAEMKVKSLGQGEKLHVLGIPRINLEEVYTRVKESKNKSGQLTLPLPYEMIIVGVYE